MHALNYRGTWSSWIIVRWNLSTSRISSGTGDKNSVFSKSEKEKKRQIKETITLPPPKCEKKWKWKESEEDMGILLVVGKFYFQNNDKVGEKKTDFLATIPNKW